MGEKYAQSWKGKEFTLFKVHEVLKECPKFMAMFHSSDLCKKKPPVVPGAEGAAVTETGKLPRPRGASKGKAVCTIFVCGQCSDFSFTRVWL